MEGIDRAKCQRKDQVNVHKLGDASKSNTERLLLFESASHVQQLLLIDCNFEAK